MKVIKALNNNMVLCMTEDHSDVICQGKGIGFGKRKGDSVDESLIERKFLPGDKAESRYFQDLFSQIPDDIFVTAEDVLAYARKEKNIKVKDRIILPLCDHMAGALERYKEGTELSNPMLYDIRQIYPQEFEVGQYALTLIRERYHVNMKEDEAAFIAYHFASAELENRTEYSLDDITVLMRDVLAIVEQSFQIELNRSDWNYQRFLTHLRFFAKRVLGRSGYADEQDNELFEELAGRYKHILNCVNRIADHILIDYHYEISMDERLYLLIHIERITRKYRNKKM